MTKDEIKSILYKTEYVSINIIPESEIKVFLWLSNIGLLESRKLKSYLPTQNQTMSVLNSPQIQLNLLKLQ